jgi:hypothetical protein
MGRRDKRQQYDDTQTCANTHWPCHDYFARSSAAAKKPSV